MYALALIFVKEMKVMVKEVSTEIQDIDGLLSTTINCVERRHIRFKMTQHFLNVHPILISISTMLIEPFD